MKETPRFFYGWVIVGCAMFALLVANGFTIGGISVFDESLLREFGWSRATLKFRDLLTFAIAGLLGPLAGYLADRFGVRKLMLAGSVMLVVALSSYSQITSARGMYGVHVILALVLLMCGLIVDVMLVSRWFVRNRGKALGILTGGASLGGAAFPQVCAWLLRSYGWRTSFLILASLGGVLFVLVWLLVKEYPADMGLEPMGLDRNAVAKTDAGMEYSAALRTVTFWALAVTAMTTFYSIMSVSAHLFLHLRAQGFEPAAAARGLSLLFFAGLLGKFSVGFLADVMDRKRILQVSLILMFLGSVLLLSGRPGLLWPFVALFGFGWGGIYTLLQFLTVSSFGLRAAGKILGTISVLDALGGGLGPWVTGVLFDRAHSYQTAFTIVCALLLVAIAAAAAMRVSPAPVRRETPRELVRPPA
jgi:MFS family permease